MTFTIRTARAADVPAMHKVRTSVRENRLSDAAQITEASYFPFVEAGSACVAETAAGILGFAAVDASRATVWALFVDPTAEGAGIGGALHLRIIAWAREQGITELSLTTEADSRAARFYSCAGWIEEGVTAGGEVRFRKSLS